VHQCCSKQQRDNEGFDDQGGSFLVGRTLRSTAERE
jgi:hypothetical protein